MPYYGRIDGKRTRGKRTAEGLLRLKPALDRAVPSRRIDGKLMLATWNIREFGRGKRGLRDDEALFYIAEIIDRFDLVAVQEVLQDLESLRDLKEILGSWWQVLMTDVTQGTAGNRERMAFLYDSRKLRFGGLAGEIVLPPARHKKGEKAPDGTDAADGDNAPTGAVGERLAADQLARTPYLAGFQAGWFKFTICTTHILYGTSQAEDPRREREIRELARFLAARASEPTAWAKNMILLGDFNIFQPTDVTFQAITAAGFKVPKQLQELPSNALHDKHYDQIAFIAPQLEDKLQLCSAGIFDYYEHVFRNEDEAAYAGVMGRDYEQSRTGAARSPADRTDYYRDWRTYRMSDHLPMWIELDTDFSVKYLDAKSKLEVDPARAEDLVPA